MSFDYSIVSGGKRLRCGYTTGTCAALAAKAACRMLLTGGRVEEISVLTPKGIPVAVPVLEISSGPDGVRCAVRKDGGDDCDATDGALIFARVSKRDAGITVDGGEGVGRVTKPGLDQPVGSAAINSVPRRMIAAEIGAECRAAGYGGGIFVLIFVPDGARIAERTFNPNLGIRGGISILGTSGIVEPRSLQALVDSIGVEMRVAAASGARELILTPGNYGEEFLGAMADLRPVPHVTISNFFGDALDFAAAYGFETILIVSHIGKLVKLAGGIMNTHSACADCRAELFTVHAALCGAPAELLRQLMDCPTTDGCVELLRAAGLLPEVLDRLLERIQYHLDRRSRGAFRVGAVAFSRESGLLGVTQTGQKIWNDWRIAK